ncbi:MAG TPA: 5-formyltetrahydrofolate cyclo-ligase [Xanthomonadales bacterium]|nr:5-formyltetrahydrofolate cyclo-ligase [Xanthomonadales bacterium]
MAEDAPISHTDERDRIRRHMKTRRAALGARERLEAGAGLADVLLDHEPIRSAGSLAGYWSVGGEAPLHALIPRLGTATRFHLPRLGDDGRLRFAPWRPGEPLEANRFGIPEPAVALSDCLDPDRIDIVLVPLLAFDPRGHRLGMGAGWYDRSFAGRRRQPPPPLLIGIGYAFQQVERIPDAPHDVPLDLVATERELHHCTG